jgi:hypothetical protein
VDKIRSITRKEYDRARERDIPIFIFVEAGVLGELRTYQKNRDTKDIQYAHVDDRRVFEMIEEIMGERRNNYVKEFSSADDIISWLREQWSGIFADMLRQKVSSARIKEMEIQINELSQVVKSLKAYSEVIMRTVAASTADTIIKEQTSKRLEELLTFLSSQNLLPTYLKGTYKLNESLEQIVRVLVESDDLQTALKKLLNPKQIQEFHVDFSEEWQRGPWRDFENIKQQYKSALEKLRN